VLAAGEAAADAVELEADVGAPDAAAVAPAVLAEARHRAAERRLGAVLGRGTADDEDVRRRATLAWPLAFARALRTNISATPPPRPTAGSVMTMGTGRLPLRSISQLEMSIWPSCGSVMPSSHEAAWTGRQRATRTSATADARPS
jgi:hypothetical protein